MRKRVAAIFMAIIVSGLSIISSMQVHAEDLPREIRSGENVDTVEEDETISVNRGTVDDNEGTITKNAGTVKKNDGEIGTNYAKVEENIGSIGENQADVLVNRDTVTTNKGTVGNNTADGTIVDNNKTITTNNGTVNSNNNGGTITTNSNTGIVGYNGEQGIVVTNKGTITDNAGTVQNNFGVCNNGTVANNYGGTVNNGTVANNYGGTVNNGTVENNYGGTINGATVVNQWYEYIINGGKCTSISNRTDAQGKNWIGKATSEDEDLGFYYITVTANNGMTFDYAEFEGGEAAAYTENEDGSYTFGNIAKAISIFFKQIISNTSNGSDSSSTNDETVTESFETVAVREEAIPIASFTSDEAVVEIPEEAKSLGASYNLSVITSPKGFAAAINKISEVVNAQNADSNKKSGKVTSVTIYSEKPINFTTEILERIENSGLDYSFIFMHNGKMYKVTIPRGTKVDLNGRVYEGPLFIGRLLGTTEEIK